MKKLLWPSLLTFIFLCSAGLVGYSWLIFQMSRGAAAARQGELATAAEIYESAETPFRAVPWLARFLKEDYEKLVFDQVNLMFAQQEPEAIVDKFEEALSHSPTIKDNGEFTFWMGNLFFRRAMASQDGEEALDHLKSALTEFQRGLAMVPEDWDLKYNFELISQIFNQKDQDRKKEGEKVKSILDKMRPPQEKKQNIAPEKLG